MENTEIRHTFTKIRPELKYPRFSIKTPEPQIKQKKNNRYSEKTLAVAALITTLSIFITNFGPRFVGLVR